MRELGASSAELHREVGEWLATRGGLDEVIVVGEEAKPLVRVLEGADVAVHWTADAETAAPLAEQILRDGDTVLIKGSRGVALEAVVDHLIARRGEEA